MFHRHKDGDAGERKYRKRGTGKERDEKKKKKHRPASELYSWILALSGSSLITLGCSLKLSGNGLCYTKKGIITLFSSFFSDKHTPYVGARGHIHTHWIQHAHTLFQSVVLPYTHWVSQALCGCESLSVALALLLHARGLVNYLPKRTQSSGGKGGEGDVPVFEGTWSLQHSVEWQYIHALILG